MPLRDSEEKSLNKNVWYCILDSPAGRRFRNLGRVTCDYLPDKTPVLMVSRRPLYPPCRVEHIRAVEEPSREEDI